MEDSLREKSHPDDEGTGCCRRNALDLVSYHSVDQLSVLTCRRNTLEAICQLALMCGTT
jgi:hypothetical protein